ncbi:hypothetical protein JOC70_003686 [Clostridium pascui]|nr:hypothetical protein [Clostridium pascui]
MNFNESYRYHQTHSHNYEHSHSHHHHGGEVNDYLQAVSEYRKTFA